MSQNTLVNTNKDTFNEVEAVKKDLDSKKATDSKNAADSKKAAVDSKKAAVDSKKAASDSKTAADSSGSPKKAAVDSSVDKKTADKKKAAVVDSTDVAKKDAVDSTDVAKKDAADVGKKKTETDGYKKIQLMMNTAKNETIEEVQKGLKKDLEEFKNSIMADLQEIKNSITRLSSNKSSSSNENGATLSNTADLVSKLNDLDTKLSASNEKQEFNFNWLKIALDGVLHKNDIDLDVKPVIKGEVKAVKKAPAKAKTADSASTVDLSTIKSTNFLKHQVLHDSEYILQLFNNREYEEHITNSICEHIKALPIAASFNKDADVSEKVEFFTNYVRSNESASTKLFTLLNKNTAFKKTITSNFESWKSQNTVNVNKDFLGEEDA